MKLYKEYIHLLFCFH